jgi:ABC-type transport system involved in cytochrome bd biosynthesis fused ATPase/permease subunit
MNIRGILKSGDIVIFDEPLAGLDAETRTKMIKLVKEMCKNKTLIIITHDKEILSIVDKTINLHKLQNQES